MGKKYNYIYKTTNNINGKFYIGVHSTNKIKDGYIGCGIYRQSDAIHKSKKSRFYGFPDAVKRYGYENFHKEILYYFKTKEEAYKEEERIVTDLFVNSKDNYNLKRGGQIPPCAKGIKRTDKFKKDRRESIKKILPDLIEKSSKEYIIVNLKTNVTVEVKNLQKYCLENNLNINLMRNISLNRLKNIKGDYYCCLKDNWNGKLPDNIVNTKLLYHKSGIVIEYKSLKDACNKTGCDKSNLNKVLKGKARQTKGWSCRKW